MGSQEMEFAFLSQFCHTGLTALSRSWTQIHSSICTNPFCNLHKSIFAILTDTCAFPASQLSALAARGKWAGPGVVGPPLINTQVHSTSLPAHKMLPGVIASRSCQCGRKKLTSVKSQAAAKSS